MVTKSLVLLSALLPTNGDTITCAIAANRGCSFVLITLPAGCLCVLVLVVMKGTCLTWFMTSQREPARWTRSCNKIYIALIEVKKNKRPMGDITHLRNSSYQLKSFSNYKLMIIPAYDTDDKKACFSLKLTQAKQ